MGDAKQCPSYEGCEAPLCPLDENLEDAFWYPDEEVCGGRGIKKPHWVRIQRRIQKLKVGYDAGYFTAKMLSNIRSVRNGIRGINPSGRADRQGNCQNALISEIKSRNSYAFKGNGVKGRKDTSREKQLVFAGI